MKASSSLLAALMGGPASFSFVFAGIARYMPANVVPRVAIESTCAPTWRPNTVYVATMADMKEKRGVVSGWCDGALFEIVKLDRRELIL